MWTLLVGVANKLFGIGGDYLKQKHEEKQAKHDLKMETLSNKARLMRSKQQYNQTWEIAALKETPKFLRIASFLMFSGPILMNMFFPYFDLDATLMWEGLKSCPAWWVKCFTVMNGTIWGCMELREMGGFKGLLGTSSKRDPDGGASERDERTELDKWFDELDETMTAKIED